MSAFDPLLPLAAIDCAAISEMHCQEIVQCCRGSVDLRAAPCTQGVAALLPSLEDRFEGAAFA